jgi:hypothetical protein
MKLNKVILILMALAVLLGSSVSSANAIAEEKWPDCGEKVVETFGVYSHSNLNITYIDSDLSFKSYNGWKIYLIWGWHKDGTGWLLVPFPDGTTSYTRENISEGHIGKFRVELKKDCDYTPKCKPTGDYVYTLLGNYPCNLISSEKPIPDRFLNPGYFGALCALPDNEFEWNGKWTKSTVKDCGGYEVGGNHYDTRK